MNSEKRIGLAWQGIAYIISLIVAVLSYQLLPEWHFIWKFLAADIFATISIFIFSRISGNSSFYDPFWSVQPIVIGFFLLQYFSNTVDINLREGIVLFLVAMWGVRLTYNFMRGWTGLHEQDWRYNDLKEKHGGKYWAVSFGGIHMFPTLLVFGGCLSLFVVFSYAENSFGIWDVIALVITTTSITIETVADQQLHVFKNSNPEKGSILATGLWSKMRHPNYTGEIGFWWGLYIFALAANPSFWWTLIGPLTITLLFVFISIPMIDQRMLSRKNNYKEHMKKLPALFPRI